MLEPAVAVVHDVRNAAEVPELFQHAARALGGLGFAHLVPGLGQYWHPVLLGARVTGWAELAGARIDLDGASTL